MCGGADGWGRVGSVSMSVSVRVCIFLDGGWWFNKCLSEVCVCEFVDLDRETTIAVHYRYYPCLK